MKSLAFKRHGDKQNSDFFEHYLQALLTEESIGARLELTVEREGQRLRLDIAPVELAA